MDYVTDFNQLLSIEEDGGKGHNLKKLIAKGFEVPEGIVINASFYRDNYPKPGEFDYGNNKKLDAQCKIMQKRVKSVPLPKKLLEDIKNKLKKFGNNQMYAVRSSSTYEDLADAAFAGQHETYLNVSLNKLKEKIKLCYASLWGKRAVLYRKHHGFDQREVSMAIVIQRLIPSHVSGVVFSVNPISGKISDILIESNFGLGESVVGGEAVTDSWVVDNNASVIKERRINKKSTYAKLRGEGIRTEKQKPELASKPCLSDDEIFMISKTAKQIESAFGSPQDIEWAIHNKRLYILQSRPQTKIPPHFTRDESAERFPEPLTPLTWSYVEKAFNTSLEYSLKMMSISLPTRPWFSLQKNYVYGNQNAVKILAMYQPFEMNSLDDIERNRSMIRKKFQWVIDLPNLWLKHLDLYLLELGRISNKNLAKFTFDDFKLLFDELYSCAENYFKPNIAISMTQNFLVKVLFKYILLIEKDQTKAGLILKNILAAAPTKTSQINKEIYGLSQMARKDERLYSLLRMGGKGALKKMNIFPEFKSVFEEFIKNYGHRETSFDYYNPTWKEVPEVVLDLIYLTASNTPPEIMDEHEIKRQSVNATQQIIQKSPAMLHYFVSEIIRLSLTFTWLDDLEHFETTRINLLVREIIGKFGNKFFMNKEIKDGYDLFFLKKEEIESLKTYMIPEDLKEKIAQRKKSYFASFKEEPPWDLQQADKETIQDTNVLKGIPGSPGKYSGKVFIVEDLRDFAMVPENAILIARTTNPSWTPLFYKAKALITESGGPLSHGAVTAREVGIPAVMCIRNALKIFSNGEKVTVDGTKGVVKKE